MQASLERPQTSSQKVKNILVRHQIHNSQFSETSYILKYAPKYYKSLALQVTSQRQFLSKIKKFKKLKSLKFTVNERNYSKDRWLLGRLNGMSGLLRRLEILGLYFFMNNSNIGEFFQRNNKNLLSHLTHLTLVAGFDPLYARIPRMCKNLNSFAFNFMSGIHDERPEFRNLLTSLQGHEKLKSLSFNWPTEGRNLWRQFKPQPSLEHLVLIVGTSYLIHAGLFEEDKDIVEHWDQLKGLKTLQFNLSWQSLEEFNLMRTYVTSVLNKAQKLDTVKFDAGGLSPAGRTYEPFLAEDVPHLYETLERFEYEFNDDRGGQIGKFDLKVLKPFKNLKSVKLEGNLLPCGNIEEIVSLLEGSQKKEGEYPILELKLKKSIDSPVDWLRETLKVFERTNRKDENLKVVLDLEFGLEDLLETLEGVCNEINSVKTIEGMRIVMNFNEEYDDQKIPVEMVKEILKKYPGTRNVEIQLANYEEYFRCIKNDGEKEFSIHNCAN